jgi:histidinol-phosphatase
MLCEDRGVNSERWLPFLARIADAADPIALRLFRAGDLRVERKPDLTPVTEADRAIEAAARRLARTHDPNLGVEGEEEGATSGRSDARLLIDPIDGTRNFVRGIPIFATLLAIEEEDEVVAGLVSAPALGERWSAARGRGAFRGGRRLCVSAVGRLADATLFHGDLAPREGADLPPGFHALARQVERTRGLGDFWQHLLVAEGCGEVAVDPTVRAWDVAPLVLIAEEAGGQWTTLAGERSLRGGSLVTTNGRLHETALRVLMAADP